MCLLDFVEQNHAVRVAPDPFRQLAPVFVPDVARRRADELGDRVLLHVLGHVESDQRFLILEEELGQAAGNFRLAHARGAEKDEGAHRPVRVLHAEPRASDRFGNSDDGGFLSHDAPPERVLHVQELLGFLDLERSDRDSRPGGDDLLDVAARDLLSGVASLGRLRLGPFDLLFQLDLALVSLTICRVSSSSFRRFCVSATRFNFTLAPASSRRSMALSGKKRSVM